MLHGEPHPGNVLATADGLLFVGFETCCRGPVEFDLAQEPITIRTSTGRCCGSAASSRRRWSPRGAGIGTISSRMGIEGLCRIREEQAEPK